MEVKAVVMDGFGGPEVLRHAETDEPELKPGTLLISVRAASLNRADILQRKGHYPPPPDESPILGLELAGTVEAVGAEVTDWKCGDRVFSLVGGGGYAEKAVIPAGTAMRVPDAWSFVEAAAVPEAFLTAYMNLYWLGGLQSGEHVLIHSGASGVGTAAIQLARETGAKVAVTAGSEDKLEFCRRLGAVSGWNYRRGSFVPWVKEITNGVGTNLILDFVGAPYWQANLDALAFDGRLVLIGLLGGTRAETTDLSRILIRRLKIMATTLRSLSKEDKTKLTREFASRALPLFNRGRLRPVIDRTFDWTDVREAHEYMENNRNAGKIVLTITNAISNA